MTEISLRRTVASGRVLSEALAANSDLAEVIVLMADSAEALGEPGLARNLRTNMDFLRQALDQICGAFGDYHCLTILDE